MNKIEKKEEEAGLTELPSEKKNIDELKTARHKKKKMRKRPYI